MKKKDNCQKNLDFKLSTQGLYHKHTLPCGETFLFLVYCYSSISITETGQSSLASFAVLSYSGATSA